jgi:uncharacterized protein YjiS (DUF1127 family)
MQQIADWLNSLGMSEYAQRFAENRIDFSVLRDLTDQDLQDLGIVLGDRRKIFAGDRRVGERTGRGTRGAICSAGADPDCVPNPDSRGSGRRTPLPHRYVL